ncbi:hypothetical protein [Alteraurantiacibacter palmitatis]|uniref:ABC transporter permease n=1 Tax=Alteraurantiacibacter palmitatis TaxID=2054628 RepID=A0ABV7E0G9_9SPHN
MNAIMTNFDIDAEKARETCKWDGLSEVDQALSENRLTAYRIRKAWADPLSRALTIACIAILVLFAAFVVYWDLIKA